LSFVQELSVKGQGMFFNIAFVFPISTISDL